MLDLEPYSGEITSSLPYYIWKFVEESPSHFFSAQFTPAMVEYESKDNDLGQCQVLLRLTASFEKIVYVVCANDAKTMERLKTIIADNYSELVVSAKITDIPMPELGRFYSIRFWETGELSVEKKYL